MCAAVHAVDVVTVIQHLCGSRTVAVLPERLARDDGSNQRTHVRAIRRSFDDGGPQDR